MPSIWQTDCPNCSLAMSLRPGNWSQPERVLTAISETFPPHPGQTPHPAGAWTVQQARNLALNLDHRFEDFRFLIRDRGSNFTASFDAVFQAAGTTIARSAVQAPRMNAICERLVGTLRRELLDRVL